MKRNIKSLKAFTLIELLVVVLILGILLAVAIPSYLSSVANSRMQTANSNAHAIATAIQAGYVSAGGTHYATQAAADKFPMKAAGDGLNATGTVLTDLGGALPLNPCTGNAAASIGTANSNDYIVSGFGDATGLTVTASQGTNCAGTTATPVSIGQ